MKGGARGNEAAAPQTLGCYRVIRELGCGAMARVYLGEHALLGRRAALKVLDEEIAAQPGARAAFLREARIASSLQHRNVVEVYDFGDEGGRCYAVMELLDGETLAALVEGGPLPMTLLLDLGRQIAAALDVLHGRGMLHCDVKPDNVIAIEDAGAPRAKLIDFGICLPIGESWAGPHAPGLVGTPAYMAPEQIAGDPLDARSDVYAFGALLYELVTGAPPFQGDLRDVLVATVADAPPPLPPETPARLAELVLTCLAKEPSQRPLSMWAVEQELDRALSEYRRATEALDLAIDDEACDAWFRLDPYPF